MMLGSDPFASLPSFGSGGYPGGPMSMAGPSTFTGQPMGMFGSQGPYGGAMGMNPLARLAGVLGHAQGNPMGAQTTPEQHKGFNPLMMLSPIAGMFMSGHPNIGLGMISPALGIARALGAFK